LDYLRQASQHTPGGNAPFDIGDPNLRLSYFVIDESGSRLLDLVTRLEPVAVEWVSQTFQDVTNSLRFEWQFLNGVQASARGKYRIGMGEAVSGWVPFELDPLGSKRFQATFPFKPVEGSARFKMPVFIDIEMGGKTLSFPRELEAIRDISLGQRVALSTYDSYTDTSRTPLSGADSLPEGENGVVMRVDADPSFLFFTFDIAGVPFNEVAGNPALVADLAIDARPSVEVGKFGFVDKVRLSTGSADGAASVDRPQLAAFGDGYNMILMSEGIATRLETRGAETKRLEVRVPRSYLFRHEWNLGSPTSIVGINAILTFAEPDAKTGAAGYPANLRFIHTAPNGGPGRTLYQRDPRGLGILRLTTDPVNTWSAHLY
ncbi:MAG: hypothetical protein KDL87_07300, partial [Verrucomicrobiae bacterium]|nr:hypothetical protein [Verrucomicrobiae bacterium]